MEFHRLFQKIRSELQNYKYYVQSIFPVSVTVWDKWTKEKRHIYFQTCTFNIHQSPEQNIRLLQAPVLPNRKFLQMNYKSN
jgi:hypothetical protein